MKAAPTRRNQAWLAVCCTAALVAVILSFFVTNPNRANAAAPPTGGNSSIPTAPGTKPTPDPTDDPCRLASCAPTATNTPESDKSYALPGKNGDQSNQTQDKDQTNQSSTKRNENGPPDLVGALTGDRSCSDRPHVRVPKSGGQAAGECLPVGAFGVMGESENNDDPIDARCTVSQVFCSKESGGTAGDNGVERALATQFGFVWESYLLTVDVAAWFTSWAVAFKVFGELSEFADTLRNTWDKRVIGQIGLGGVGGFILGVAVLWAGLLMLFHRFRRGLVELFASILIAVIASAFLLHPGDTIHKTMDGARYFGLTVASITSNPGTSRSVPTSQEEADRIATRQVGASVSDKLVTSVLVKPHMIANTGKVQTGNCERLYWEMLAADGGSSKEAAYNRFVEQKSCVQPGALQPSIQRILVAVLLLVMMVIVCAFCLLTAGLLLLSQVAAAGYLAVAGIVGTLAPLPGWGRALLGKWITGLLVAVAGVIASVLIVVVYLNVLGLILGLGQSPLANFAIAIIVAFAGFKLRKRLTAGFRNRARQIGAKLEGTLHRPGGETLVERQQRRHTSVSHLQTASAVAGARAGAGAGAAGHAPVSGDEALPSDGTNERKNAVGFGARVRNAMGQTRHGRLAMETASGGSGKAVPLPNGQSAALAGGLAGVAAASVARGNQAAQRTARSVKNEVIDATTPSGSIVSSARATRTASKVSGKSGADSSARAKELIAEMRRRQQQREQELRRGLS